MKKHTIKGYASPKKEKGCLTCQNAIYCCEGDYICDCCMKNGEPLFVIEDFNATDDYNFCKGKKYREA